MKYKVCFLVVSLALSLATHATTIEMKVNGLVCSFCAQGIEKTLRKNPATADVIVSLESKLVAVTTKPGTDISDAELTTAMTDAGYEVKGISRTERTIGELRQVVGQAEK